MCPFSERRILALAGGRNTKLHVLTESNVVEHLRGTLLYYDLVVARKGLIDDYLLGRELEASGERLFPEDVTKFVTDRWATLTSVDPKDDANATHAALMKGGDFGLVARAQSEDPDSAVFDGMAGPIGQFDQRLDPAIRDAIFALTPENPVSAPVKGRVGWYLIKLEHVLKGGEDPTLADPDVGRHAA